MDTNATPTRRLLIAKYGILLSLLTVSWFAAQNSSWAAAIIASVCVLAAPLTALHERLYRVAPVLAVLVLLTNSSAPPLWLALVAFLALALTQPVLLARHIPASWQVLAPMSVSVALAYLVYRSSTTAMVLALVAAITATLAAASYARRTIPLTSATFILGLVLLIVTTLTTAAEGLPLTAATAAGASVALLAATALSLRSDSRPSRVVAITAAMLVFSVPAAVLAGNDSNLGPSTGLSASANITECFQLGSDTIKAVECYSAVLIDEFRTNGLPQSIDLVYTMFNDPRFGPHFKNNCHEALHFLGKASALRLGGNLRDVISMGTNLCSAGFGHGVWEMEYGSMPTDAIVEQVPTICTGWEGNNRSEEGSSGIGCRHILGHTLATRYRGHVEDIAQICLVRDPQYDPASELIEDEIISRGNCLAGLFMENFLDLNRFRNEDVGAGGPFETCEQPKVAAIPTIQWGCYNEIGAMVVPRFDYSMAASLRACQDQATKVSLPDHIKMSCYDSIIRAITPALEYSSTEQAQACTGVPEGELMNVCIKYIAAEFAFSSNDVDGALRLCNEGISDPAALKSCIDRVDDIAEALRSSKVSGDSRTPQTAPPQTAPPGADLP